jgi:glycosyltransferase involved in cell wall biosynthesis
MKTLSLCFINKNDSHHFPRLIKSFEGIAEEIVMIDTGSNDGSVEKAKNLGIKVFEKKFPLVEGDESKFNFNFAAAKNYALSKCSMEITCILDADDELASESRDRLIWWKHEEMVLKKCVLFVIRNLGKKESYFTHTCMIKTGMGHFATPIHESLAPKEPGIEYVRDETITIIHHGYLVAGVDGTMLKKERNRWAMEKVIKHRIGPPDSIARTMQLYANEVQDGQEKMDLYKDGLELAKDPALIDELLECISKQYRAQEEDEVAYNFLMENAIEGRKLTIGVASELAQIYLKCGDPGAALKACELIREMPNPIGGTFQRYRTLKNQATAMEDYLASQMGFTDYHDYVICWADVNEGQKGLLDYIYLWIECFKELGINFKAREVGEFQGFDPHAQNILFGYNCVPFNESFKKAKITIIQLEQLDEGNRWWKHCEPWLKSGLPIIEYSQKNMEFLEAKGIPAKLVQPAFHPKMQNVKFQKHRDIDVLFIGAVPKGSRRWKLLTKLQDMGYEVQNPLAYGRYRDDYLSRAKLVLNIHFFKDEEKGDFEVFESIRVSYLLNNGVPVLSEESSHNPYPYVKCVSYDNLIEETQKLLEDDWGREKYAKKCFQEFKKVKMLKNIKEVL